MTAAKRDRTTGPVHLFRSEGIHPDGVWSACGRLCKREPDVRPYWTKDPAKVTCRLCRSRKDAMHRAAEGRFGFPKPPGD